MDRLLELLGPAVQFVYSCWDRIVLNGYIERLQRPENLVYFFHEVVGIACIEPAVLEQRTNAYKAWVRRVTDDLGIAVQAAPPAAPKGVRKEDVVQPYYRQLKGAEGVACVFDQPGAGPHVRLLPAAAEATQWGRQLSPHQGLSETLPSHYWYVLDPIVGPMSVRVASYFPFNAPAISTATRSSPRS